MPSCPTLSAEICVRGIRSLPLWVRINSTWPTFIPDSQHVSHALQLRQAKLSFPNVYLLAGVNTDEDVTGYKARPVMTHPERSVIPNIGLCIADIV